MMWIWEWRCHGYLWQLIPSRRYPERNGFQPTCPECGAKPRRTWANTWNTRRAS